jgi:uncharacterized membrane protein
MGDVNMKGPDGELEIKVLRLILMIFLIVGGFKLINWEVSSLHSVLQAAILGVYVLVAVFLCLRNR